MKPDTNTIILRRKAKEYAHQAAEDGELNLRDCEFIGGGVADELLWLAEDLDFTILVAENGVNEMLKVIADKRHTTDVSAEVFENLVSVKPPSKEV